MKLTFFLLLLATATIWAFVQVLSTNAERSAQGFFRAGLERREVGRDEAALRDLGLALELAIEDGDAELCADILFERASIYRGRGAADAAIVDLRRVLDEFAPGQLKSLVELSGLLLSEELHDEAMIPVLEVLEQQPKNAGALVSLARIHVDRAERAMEEAFDTIDFVLADAGAAAVKRAATQSAARLPGDPLRVALRHEIDEAIPDAEHRRQTLVFELLDAANADFHAARDALVRSFERAVSPRSLELYMRLLSSAGNLTQAVDFGLAIESLPEAESGVTMPLFAEALAALSRPGIAARVIQSTNTLDNPLPRHFRVAWCEMLYDAAQFRLLADVAGFTRAGAPPGASGAQERDFGAFYEGVARYRLGQYGAAIGMLDRFAGSQPRQPFPGAIGFARRIQAECARELEQLDLERHYVGLAVVADPHGDGAIWLRNAQLQQARSVPSREICHSYAMAIRLLPAQRHLIFPEWVAAGRAAAIEAGQDFDVLRARVRAQDRWFRPDIGVTSFELFQFALDYQAEDTSSGAMACLEELLDRYPGFLPAMEELARVYIRVGRHGDAADQYLGMLEVAGVEDGHIVEALRTLPDRELSPANTRRLMQLDPHRTGLLELARGLLARGDADAAWRGMELAQYDVVGHEGRLVAGHILADLGRWTETLEVLAPVNPGSYLFLEAVALRLEAALETRQREVVEALLDDITRTPNLDPGATFPAADILLQRGDYDSAIRLLEYLDTTAGEQQGEILLRLAIAHVLRGDTEEVDTLFDRADAFREDGGPEIGRLLMAVDQNNWPAVPARVRDLLRTGYQPDPYEAIALAALETNLNEARILCERELEAAPDDPLLFLAHCAIAELGEEQSPLLAEQPFLYSSQTQRFLRGTPAAPRDGRQALAHIFATRHAEWSLWSLSILRRADDKTAGGLWPSLLSAVAFERIENLEAARKQLERLTSSNYPAVPPPWTMLERLELERLGQRNHPQLLELRRRRREALGTDHGGMAEVHLGEAVSLRERGQFPNALRKVREALSLDADLLPARMLLAQVLADLEQDGPAVSAFGRFFAEAPPIDSEPYLEEFLAILERAAASEEISRSAHRNELDSLETLHPASPLVALALAEWELATPDAPRVGVARAYRRLELFREATGGVPIESLHHGATRDWTEFHLRLDPVRAEAFVEAELRALPSDLELWVLLGDTYVAQGRLGDAADHYESIVRMIPHAEAHLKLADLLSVYGSNIGRVRQHLQAAAELSGRATNDPEFLLLDARAGLNALRLTWDEGIEAFATLYRRVQSGKATLPPGRLESIYGTALVHRGLRTDSQLAKSLLAQAAEHTDDPLELERLTVLGHLSAHVNGGQTLPEEDPEEPADGDADDAAEDPAEAEDDAADDASADDSSS